MGPSQDDPTRVSAGTVELLGQKAIVRRDGELDIPDDTLGSQSVWGQDDAAELEDAVDAAKDAPHRHNEPAVLQPHQDGREVPEGNTAKSSFAC